MTHWIALLCDAADPATLQATGTWALQFSPRVALQEEAVLVEASSSLRLFGGEATLHQRLDPACSDDAAAIGIVRLAWAPTALASLAAVRAGMQACSLDMPTWAKLPLETLSAARPAAPMLARLGCQTLADILQLPRAGLVRRFGQPLVDALDRLQGRLPDALAWLIPPPTFVARHELPFRVEHAGALITGARRLLLALEGWLAARQAGVAAFTLFWQHDAMRSRGVAAGGSLTVRCATPTRSAARLEHLLSEHLRQITLAAPVGDLRLEASDIRALATDEASLLPRTAQAQTSGEASARERADALTRIAIRLGANRVLRPEVHADRRAEREIAWVPHDTPDDAQPADAGQGPIPPHWKDGQPRPAWRLPQPDRLPLVAGQPALDGKPLVLLAGPHRIEGGWWGPADTEGVQRDHWVARDSRCRLLWIYQEHSCTASPGPWFWQGLF